MGLADSVESALGVSRTQRTARAPDDTYQADNEGEAVYALSNGLAKRAYIKGQKPDFNAQPSEAQQGGLVDSITAALNAPAPKVEKAKPAERPSYNEANIAPIVGLGETALNTATGIGTGIVGGWRGLATLATGGSMDDAVKAVHGTDANAIAKTYQPETKEGKFGAEVMASPYNPLNWWGKGADMAGGGVAALATKAGASPEVAAGAGTAVNVGLNALPLFLLKGGKKAPAANEMLGNEKAAIPAQAGGESMPLEKVPGSPEPVATATKPRIKLKSVEAAAETTAEAPKFETSVLAAPEGKVLPAAEQARRAEVLKRVGIENVRKSAIEGDAMGAATDHQTSKLTNASGQLMKSTLDNEKAALAKHAEGIVADTGGTMGMDESARMARGNTILAPLDGLKKWFDKNISSLYKAADEKAGGVPVDLPEVHNFVVDHRARFLGTIEGKQLLEGVTERMKSLGMVDKDGNPVPVTVAQAEKLNQYLGEVWTPRTGRLIGELKDNILDGVSRTAGEDIYKQARALRAMRAATLDNPNGISKIMDASGPEGINRSVAVEKVADSITSMPVEQLEHVIKTLKNVPKELQPQAQSAISEIQAHIANKVLETGTAHAGQWNAKGVSKILNGHSQKIGIVFTPEQIAKFGDLNEAGHILAKDQSYPGAAVQEHNLVRRGAMAGIRSGSAAAGGAVAGPLGAAVGERIGAGIASRFEEGASLRATQKRVVKLSDFPK